MSRRPLTHHAFGAAFALLLGVGLSYGLVVIIGADPNTRLSHLSDTVIATTFANRVVPGKFAPVSFKPPKTGSMVGVDLPSKQVVLFKNGEIVKTLSLLASGAIGSPWETRPGNYAVLAKEEVHRSPIALATMPWAVQISGNLFFHGEVTSEAGSSKKSGLPLGSLYLANDDAHRLYNFVKVGTPVTVLGTLAETSQAHLALATAGEVGLVFQKLPAKAPAVSAYSYLVQDLDSGEVLLEKNPQAVMPIASVTKLITTVVARERLAATTTTTVSKQAAATFGSAGALRAGERMSIGELYYPLLLESSNKAAEVLAEAGGRSHFMERMNTLVQELGMTKTSFTDPSGLDPRNVSTAADLVLLARHLTEKQQELLRMTTLTSATSNDGAHLWPNHNRLVVGKNKKYIGGKTGYIPEAGQTSIAIFSFPAGEFVEKKVAVVLLRSYNRDQDTRNILRYLQQGLYYDTGVPVNDDDLSLSRFSMRAATTTDAVNLIAVGNMALDESLGAALAAKGSSFAKLFHETYFVKTASLAMANLEGAVTTVNYQVGTEVLRTPLTAPALLGEVGFDLLHVANSHAGDWGRSGLTQTLRELASKGIAPLGAGDDAQGAKQLLVQEKHGVRLGFLGVSMDAPEWLTTPANLPVVLSGRDPELLSVVRAAASKVHHLVVTVSLPADLPPGGEAAQAFTHSLIDAGAHVVLGVGPRAVGPVERYDDGVIAYSLGDFVRKPEEGREARPQGIALEFIFDKEKIAAVNAEQVTLNESLQPVLADSAE